MTPTRMPHRSRRPLPAPQTDPSRVRRLLAPLLGLALTAPAGLVPAAQAQLQPVATASPSLAPALPSRFGTRPARLAALPPLPAPVGSPVLQSQVSCPSLQQRLSGLLAGETSAWSVTVADGSGRLLADVNGTTPRVPASNQKLISTAFALDQLGPDFRLNTQLWRLPDGRLRLVGQGDPDLAVPQLQRIARQALIASGATPQAPVQLEMAEESQANWWPQGWHWGDRSTAYGAPVTRLAITSNVIDAAVMNPPARLRRLMERATEGQAPGAISLRVISSQEPLPPGSVLVHQEPSTSMDGLLSLANTESHNFTAEVLLRSAARTWDQDQAAGRAMAWLQQQGLPMQGVRVVDGSGLDRSDRLTSRFLAALLLRMGQHPYARQYVASMAIAGQRGTLRHLFNGTSLDGNLHAKTGTLTGVRAISGVLQTSDGPRIVSAISNGASAPNRTIGQMLQQVQRAGSCGPGVESALISP